MPSQLNGTRLRRPGSATLPAAAAAILSILFVASSTAVADSIWTVASGPNSKPFERKNLKIEKMQGDALVFRSAGADRQSDPKPIKDIHYVVADNEPALNAAEKAYIADKWDEAVTGYQKAASTSGKEWVKQYATLRLLTAAEKSGKFSAAAAAFVTLVQTNPTIAKNKKPDVSKAKKT